MAIHDVIGGRYELTQPIASGGMAQVYLAIDRILRRQVAVKILSMESASDPVFVERFRREAQAIAQLNHPNVVSIYDWGQTHPKENGDPSIYYMVMEYVHGENLKQRLRGDTIPEADALDIAAQIAAALEVAHRHGVIHRDIKPQNVLLDPFGMAKVADFGIAHTAGVTQLTKTNAVAGTAHYLSPEQAQSRPIDNRSDLYSLGVVLFEILTGRELFQGSTLVEVAMHHVHDPPPRPTSLQPSISPATEAIVLRALEKDPANRFHDASEMRTALLETRSALLSGRALPEQEGTAAVPLVNATPISRVRPDRARSMAESRLNPIGSTDTNESRWPARLRMAVPAVFMLLVGLPAAFVWQSHQGSQSAVNRPKSGAVTTTSRRVTSRSQAAPARGQARAISRQTAIASVPTRASPAATVFPTSPTATQAPIPPPTRAPSIAALQQPDASAPASSNNSPAAAVSDFYRMISAGNLAGAISLETANMKQVWPPETAIMERFSQTQQISIHHPQVMSLTGNTATVGVSGFDLERPGSPRSNQNFYLVWTLVKQGHGWMLDSVSS